MCFSLIVDRAFYLGHSPDWARGTIIIYFMFFGGRGGWWRSIPAHIFSNRTARVCARSHCFSRPGGNQLCSCHVGGVIWVLGLCIVTSRHIHQPVPGTNPAEPVNIAKHSLHTVCDLCDLLC